MEKLFFNIAFSLYTLAMALYFAYFLTKNERLAQLGKWLLVVAVMNQVISLLVRTYFARQLPNHGWYVPWSNWFESFSFFSMIIVIEYLLIQATRHVPVLGAFVTPVAWTTMIVAINSPFGTEIPILPPALQSYWMAIHVPVMFVSYAAFANAFAIGLAFLLQDWQIKSKKPTHLTFRLPSLEELDSMIYSVIWKAVPVLALGIFLGARWAYDVWGRYWGWDAKETWAVITLMVYIVLLHLRLMIGWRGRKTAYLSLVGFVVVIVTYIGVNYLSELHGFLSGGGG